MTALQVIGLGLEQPYRLGELIEALRDAKAFAEQKGATGAVAGLITDGGELAGNIPYVVEFENFAALGRYRIALTKAIEGGSPPPLAALVLAENSPVRVTQRHVRAEIDPGAQPVARPSPSVWIGSVIQPLPGRGEDALRVVQDHVSFARGLGFHAHAFRIIGGPATGNIAVSVFFPDWEAAGAYTDRALDGSPPPLAVAGAEANAPFTPLGIRSAEEIPL